MLYQGFILSCIDTIIGVILGMLIICAMLLAGSSRLEPVTSLKRPIFSKSETINRLEVMYNHKLEAIDIKLSPKRLTEQELLSLYDELYPEIEKLLLSANPSTNQVTTELNLPFSFTNDRIKGHNILLQWLIPDSELIGSDGKLSYDHISPEGTSTSIHVEMNLEEYDYPVFKTIPLTLYPIKEAPADILKKEIEAIINNSSALTASYVELPASSTLGTITFYKPPVRFPIIFIPLGFVFLFILIYSRINKLKTASKARAQQLENDYSQIVSKLCLLYLAGLNIKNSFIRILYDYDSQPHKIRFAYEEMRLMLQEISNGKNEGLAYIDYGHNCSLPSYIRLGTLLNQNLKSGSGDVYNILEYESLEALQNRKALIKALGEQASTKAVFPILLLLIIIFIILIFPALTL